MRLGSPRRVGDGRHLPALREPLQDPVLWPRRYQVLVDCPAPVDCRRAAEPQDSLCARHAEFRERYARERGMRTCWPRKSLKRLVACERYPAACVSSREHRLSIVQRRGRTELENPITSIARMKPSKTLCSLFANDVPFPKLDVAGSSPISRSILSIT